MINNKYPKAYLVLCKSKIIGMCVFVFVCVRTRVCFRACACVRACMCACDCACVCVCAYKRPFVNNFVHIILCLGKNKY